MFKTCTKCKLKKEYTEFYKHKSRKDGYDDICKICKRKNLDKTKNCLSSYLVKLARQNNIDISVLKKIWMEQNGKCALSKFTMTHCDKFSIFNAKVIFIDDKLLLVCSKTKEMLNNLTFSQLCQFCEAIIGQ